MVERSLEILLTFPPRPLQPEERDVLAAWLETPRNPCSAFTHERRSDDPMLYRKIVVSAVPKDAPPTHFIYAPSVVPWWILREADTGELASFNSLRSALNSIWPGAPGRKAGTSKYDRHST
jgi:hypothetical protein